MKKWKIPEKYVLKKQADYPGSISKEWEKYRIESVRSLTVYGLEDEIYRKARPLSERPENFKLMNSV